jgi:hypothetical protein
MLQTRGNNHLEKGNKTFVIVIANSTVIEEAIGIKIMNELFKMGRAFRNKPDGGFNPVL